MGNDNIKEINNKWTVNLEEENIIGKGTYATIYKGTSISTGKEYAIKHIPQSLIAKDSKLKAAIQREIKISSKSAALYPHILSMYDHSWEDEGAFLILKLCTSGSLKDKIKNSKRIKEYEALKISYQIIKGLRALHSLGKVHGDLKPADILVNKGTYMLADFGFVKKSSFKMSKTAMMYKPPEFFGEDQELDISGDIWTFGIIFHEMVFGTVPFSGGKADIFQKILNKDYAEILSNQERGIISEKSINMVKRCLVKDPKNRITLNMLKNHDCFNLLGREIFDWVKVAVDDFYIYQKVYKFYCETAAKLWKVRERIEDSEKTPLFLWKKALIQVMKLRTFLKNSDIFLDTSIDVKILPKLWSKFKQTMDYKKLTSKVENDMTLIREIFNKKKNEYEEQSSELSNLQSVGLSNLQTFSSNFYISHSDLSNEEDFAVSIRSDISHTINEVRRNIKKETGERNFFLNIAARLALIYRLELSGYNPSFKKEFVRTVKVLQQGANDETLQELLKKFYREHLK